MKAEIRFEKNSVDPKEDFRVSFGGQISRPSDCTLLAGFPADGLAIDVSHYRSRQQGFGSYVYGEVHYLDPTSDCVSVVKNVLGPTTYEFIIAVAADWAKEARTWVGGKRGTFGQVLQRRFSIEIPEGEGTYLQNVVWPSIARAIDARAKLLAQSPDYETPQDALQFYETYPTVGELLRHTDLWTNFGASHDGPETLMVAGLYPEQVELIVTAAEMGGTSSGDVIRMAVANHIAALAASNPDFASVVRTIAAATLGREAGELSRMFGELDLRTLGAGSQELE